MIIAPAPVAAPPRRRSMLVAGLLLVAAVVGATVGIRTLVGEYRAAHYPQLGGSSFGGPIGSAWRSSPDGDVLARLSGPAGTTGQYLTSIQNSGAHVVSVSSAQADYVTRVQWSQVHWSALADSHVQSVEFGTDAELVLCQSGP